MQRQLTFGGGVSPRGTLLRGQSIIEYVLIIAVIGLVIVFAGPSVAGTIRNQFNLVGNTVNSGTSGGAEGGGATGGGSAEADSATVQAAVAKDAKDWTLDEQEAVAEDIAAKGEASTAYVKAEAAMKAKTKWSLKLTNDETMTYQIIGINHDNLANGTGKAGLTFLLSYPWPIRACMNATDTNVGGWEKSELRASMNSGEIWNLMPTGVQGKMKAVTKLTNNVGGKNIAHECVDATETIDRLFLLSESEIFGGKTTGVNHGEGSQYEYFACGFGAGIAYGWNRSPHMVYGGTDNMSFTTIGPDSRFSISHASSEVAVCPAFSF